MLQVTFVMRWLSPAHAIGWRLAIVIVLNAFALTLPLTAVDLYVVRYQSHSPAPVAGISIHPRYPSIVAVHTRRITINTHPCTLCGMALWHGTAAVPI